MADNKFLGDQFFRVLSTSRLPSMRQSLDQDSEKQRGQVGKTYLAELGDSGEVGSHQHQQRNGQNYAENST